MWPSGEGIIDLLQNPQNEGCLNECGFPALYLEQKPWLQYLQLHSFL